MNIDDYKRGRGHIMKLFYDQAISQKLYKTEYYIQLGYSTQASINIQWTLDMLTGMKD